MKTVVLLFEEDTGMSEKGFFFFCAEFNQVECVQ
jgi:hypothetical protein